MLAVGWQDSCGGLTDDGAGGGAGVGASMQRAAPTTVGGWRLAVGGVRVRCAVCGVRCAGGGGLLFYSGCGRTVHFPGRSSSSGKAGLRCRCYHSCCDVSWAMAMDSRDAAYQRR